MRLLKNLTLLPARRALQNSGMARFRLQVLAPGKRCVGENADGSPRMVSFTPEYVRKRVELGNQMLSAGINIPTCLAHLEGAKPVKMTRDEFLVKKALGTVGWVEQYELSADGKAFANVEVPDGADASTLKKIRFCSPRIDRFVDGDGKDWGEVFTHVALTPRPRQHNQPAAVELSLTGAIELSIDPFEGTDMGLFSKKKKKKVDLADDEEIPDGDGDGDGEGGEFKSLIEALREYGITVPEEVTNVPELIIAIKACKMPEAEEYEDGDGDGDGEPEVIENPDRPMVMSHEDKADERRQLRKRANRLFKTGKITGPIRDQLIKQAGRVDLSLDEDGEVKPTSVHERIEAYEKLGKGSTWTPRQPEPTRKDLAHGVHEVELPKELKPLTDKETLAAWDKMGSAE